MPVVQEQFASLGETTTTVDPSTGATLTVSDRSKFPQIGQFRILVQNSEVDATNRELMLVTGGYGAGAGAFTVTRGIEGTSNVAHTAPSYVAQYLTGEAVRRHLTNYVFQPRHLGLLAANGDPFGFQGSNVGTSLQPYLLKLWVPETITIANLVTRVNSAGSGLTAGSNQCGVYLSNGTRIATTDAATTLTAFTTTGGKTLALIVDGGQSLTVTGGPAVFVWAAILCAGTTRANFPRAQGNGGGQYGNLPTAETRVGTLALVTGGNGLPASFNPATDIASASQPLFVGLS